VAVFRDQHDPVLDALGDGVAQHGRLLTPDLAAGLRARAGQAVHQIGAAGAHQP